MRFAPRHKKLPCIGAVGTHTHARLSLRRLAAGFVAAAGAELFGQGSFLSQLSRSGVPVAVVLALVTASTLIPYVKGTEGGYLESLKDTYALPANVFTEKNERVHGR